MTFADQMLALYYEGLLSLGAMLKFRLTYDQGLTAHGFSHDNLEEWCHYADGSILIVRFPCTGKDRWKDPKAIHAEVCYEE